MDNQVNCALDIYITHPRNTQFRVTETTFEGFAALDDGIEARIFADTFPNLDASEAAIAITQFQGNDVWVAGQEFSGALFFSPDESVLSNCGTTWSRLKFAIRVQLLSENPDSHGTITLSGKDEDDHYTQGIALEWQKC